VTAEAIAKVVADIRAGRHVRHLDVLSDLYRQGQADGVLDSGLFDGWRLPAANDVVQRWADAAAQVPQIVVDCSAIYQDLIALRAWEGIDVYGDHPSVAMPWPEATFGFANRHGNVIVLQATVAPEVTPWDLPPDDPAAGVIGDGSYEAHGTPRLRGAADPIPWDQVRWVVDVPVWIGGMSGGRALPTTGPVHLFQLAIGAQGEPLDVHWVQLDTRPRLRTWDCEMLVLMGSLNFLNCSNVRAIEPERSRGERRRMARTGVTVTTLNVFPTRTLGAGRRAGESVGVPLTSVRGHFAEYGPRYGKGLLFGRVEGRFWIPQHARGDAAVGVVEHPDAVLRPGS
jgi:hypothetical protein